MWNELPLPILLLRKRKLRHSLGKPSRSDFVQLEVIDLLNPIQVLSALFRFGYLQQFSFQ